MSISRAKGLSAFAKLRKWANSFVMSFCPSFHPCLRPRGTARRPK